MKEGIHSIVLDQEDELQTSSIPIGKKAFQIPKLVKNPGKENVFVNKAEQSSGRKESSQQNFDAVDNSIMSSKMLPNWRSFSIPSLTPKTSNIPELPQPSQDVNSSGCDSDDEGPTLSALVAQHACKRSSPDHTSLSALAEQHLKASKGATSQLNSEFVIPSFKSRSKLIRIDLDSQPVNSQTLRLDEDRSCYDVNTNCLNMDVSEESGGFVIDLLGALNPPDIRKQLERPHSQLAADVDGHNIFDGEDQDEGKSWVQDRTCILDARPVLLLNFPLEVKSSSPFGRVICRRRCVRKLPYIRPSSPFFGNIVPFSFDTPSPDKLIQKHLRRL